MFRTCVSQNGYLWTLGIAGVGGAIAAVETVLKDYLVCKEETE